MDSCKESWQKKKVCCKESKVSRGMIISVYYIFTGRRQASDQAWLLYYTKKMSSHELLFQVYHSFIHISTVYLAVNLEFSFILSERLTFVIIRRTRNVSLNLKHLQWFMLIFYSPFIVSGHLLLENVIGSLIAILWNILHIGIFAKKKTLYEKHFILIHSYWLKWLKSQDKILSRWVNNISSLLWLCSTKDSSRKHKDSIWIRLLSPGWKEHKTSNILILISSQPRLNTTQM